MAGSFEKSLESQRHLLCDVDAQRVAPDKSVALAEVMGTQVPDIALHLEGAISLAQLQTAYVTRRVGGRATRAPPCRRPTSGSTNWSLAVGGRLRAGCAAARATAAVAIAACTCPHNSQTRSPGLGAGEQQTQEDTR